MSITLRRLDTNIELIEMPFRDIKLNLLSYETNDLTLLLDTCTYTGIKELLEVKRVPDLSIITHFHMDHCGGSSHLASVGTYNLAHPLTKMLCYSTMTAQIGFFPAKHRIWFGEERAERFLSTIGMELSSPIINSTDLQSVNGVRCIYTPGHSIDQIACKIGGFVFASDSIQGTGIEGDTFGKRIPQIASIGDYIKTIDTYAEMEPETMVLGHNYLPFNSSVVEGSNIDRLLFESKNVVKELVEMGRSILGDGFLTLGEFATRLLNLFGIRDLYPQAIITAQSILSWLSSSIEKTSEGEIEFFRLKKE